MTVLTQPGPVANDDLTPRATRYLSRPGLRERVLVMATLFLYAWGTPQEWIGNVNTGTTESSPITQLLFLAVFGHTIISLNGNWHVVLRAAKLEPLLPAFIALITLSTVWSTVPATTLQDGIILSITYITGLHLVVRFRLKEIIAMFAMVFAIGALINLGFVLAFESITNISLATGDGLASGWRVTTVTKNVLGRSSVLGFVACTAHARIIRSWFVWPAFALLNAALVLGSQSGTSLGALAGICVLSVVLLGFRGRKTFYGATMVAMMVVFATLTVLAATNLAAATGLIGKESSFTGRLPIWLNSVTFGISERPLVGFGWAGFWQTGEDFEVQVRATNFDIPHAHNSLVDAWLYLGPLGGAILVALFVRALIWSTRHIRAVPTAIGIFPTAIISLAVIYSSTEAGFISRTIQFLMFTVAISVAATQKGRSRPFGGRVQRKERTSEADVPTFATR